MNYIVSLQGQTFTPDGIVQGVEDAAAHNAELTRLELAAWALRPDRYCGYVQEETATPRPIVGQRLRLTTWMGDLLGHGTVTGVFRNNLTGSRTVSIRVRGTNGATYIGRFGDEWSQLCRIRRIGQ